MPEVDKLLEIILVLVCILHKFVFEQLLSGWPLFWVFDQALLDKIFELFRESFVDLGRFFSYNVVQDLGLLFVYVRWLTVGNLHSEDTK